jgi:ABC-type siderophore export system fused ATPase/permease subunit
MLVQTVNRSGRILTPPKPADNKNKERYRRSISSVGSKVVEFRNCRYVENLLYNGSISCLMRLNFK